MDHYFPARTGARRARRARKQAWYFHCIGSPDRNLRESISTGQTTPTIPFSRESPTPCMETKKSDSKKEPNNLNELNSFAYITAREGQSAKKRNVKHIPHPFHQGAGSSRPNEAKQCKNARHRFVVRIHRE